MIVKIKGDFFSLFGQQLFSMNLQVVSQKIREIKASNATINSLISIDFSHFFHKANHVIKKLERLSVRMQVF